MEFNKKKQAGGRDLFVEFRLFNQFYIFKTIMLFYPDC